MDICMYGIIEYIDKYYEIKFGFDWNVKDNVFFFGCYFLGLVYSGYV